MIAMIDLGKKVQRSLQSCGNSSLAIVAVAEINLSSISMIAAPDHSYRCYHMEPPSGDCSDRYDENIPECSGSLFDPGHHGNFFH